MRTTASVPPPAAQGHSSCTGRAGHFGWAKAGRGQAEQGGAAAEQGAAGKLDHGVVSSLGAPPGGAPRCVDS